MMRPMLHRCPIRQSDQAVHDQSSVVAAQHLLPAISAKQLWSPCLSPQGRLLVALRKPRISAMLLLLPYCCYFHIEAPLVAVRPSLSNPGVMGVYL
jgi:hypothetical protein